MTEIQAKKPKVKLDKQRSGDSWQVKIDGFFAGTIYKQRNNRFRASSNLMLRDTERFVQEDVVDKDAAKELLVNWFQRERKKLNGGRGV